MPNRSAFLLVSLALGVSTAHAVDVHQVVIPENVGVAIEPAHEAHVLAEPIRETHVKNKPPVWIVTQGPGKRALMPSEEARLDAIDAQAEEDARHTLVTLYFPFNKSTPSEWEPLTAVLGEALRSGSTVRLVGHADEVGSAEYNQRLSENRAIEVARHLIRQGVSKKNIKLEGHGKREPAVAGDGARNRRVVIDILKREGN
ncbi:MULTISPECIES: OmpA family protein [Pseudomonas]|uniref:OmpA family protein n=1 Tax=Pseudomonas TaxID=286 RepID=UPI00387AA98E